MCVSYTPCLRQLFERIFKNLCKSPLHYTASVV
nr:MAG TPA: hypothetical protein [Caudoviricetes sp.]